MTAASGRRVAIINDAHDYVGPALARALAARGHDLVLGDPEEGLADSLRATGVRVETVEGVSRLRTQEDADALVARAVSVFGRVDSAAVHSGQIITGSFFQSTDTHLAKLVASCMEAPYHFMKAVGAQMIEQKSGQILVMTSATAGRPTPNAPLYSSVRAGATMMVRNVAGEVARYGVQVNAVGTNYMDFPGLLKAAGATTPEGRERLEQQVPMRRLGSMEEFANFCLVFLDGTSGFTTGQFVGYAGGWI